VFYSVGIAFCAFLLRWPSYVCISTVTISLKETESMLGGRTNRWTNVNYKFQVIGFSLNSPNLDCPQATGFLCILAKTLLWVSEEQGVHTAHKTHSSWVSLSNGFILHRKHKFSPHQCNSANSDFHRWYSMLKFHYFGLLVSCFQNRKI